MQSHQSVKWCEDNLNESHGRAKVVVVGAGLAGLAAAFRLSEFSLVDVVILEASDRVGGRVNTVEHAGEVLELGAQWLHGADKNPLYDWLLDEQMLDDFEDASTGFKGMFCTQFGNEIDPKLVDKVLDIVIDSKLSLSKKCYTEIINKNNFQNASDVFRHQLEARLAEDEELTRNKQLVLAIFEWFLRYETIENSCNNMEEVSVTSYTDWTDSGDGTLLNFKHGYKSLLDWFCSRLPSKQSIQLNRQVLNIQMLQLQKNNPTSRCCWLDENGNTHSKAILLTYLDKSNGSEIQQMNVIECDHVIVTTSLGFLKQNYKTFFRPALPEAKRHLIESIGFGTVNKIMLEFDEPFWDACEGFKLVWSTEILNEGWPIWVRDIIAFDTVRRQPKMLVGWIGGQGAKLMELESDAKIGAVCLELLERFLPAGQRRPGKLVTSVSSRWNSNPFICGSYSFHSMKSFKLDVNKLYEPLYELDGHQTTAVARVLFAGEATAGKFYSTTHGAIMSGWREADRLLGTLLANGEQSAAAGSIRQQLSSALSVGLDDWFD